MLQGCWAEAEYAAALALPLSAQEQTPVALDLPPLFTIGVLTASPAVHQSGLEQQRQLSPRAQLDEALALAMRQR